MSEIPDGWSLEPLTGHVRARSGNSKIIKGKNSAEPRPGLNQGFSASGPDVWVKEAEYKGPGVVVSAVGARCGKTFLADGAWTAIANTHVLIPEATLDPRFLWYLTNNERYWVRSGTAQPFVKVKDTLARPHLIPPLDEQRRIVTILEDHLSRLDSAMASVDRVLNALPVARAAAIESAIWRNDFWGTSEHRMSTIALRDLADGGLFCDGDWVESKDQDPAGRVRLTQLADVGEGVFRDRSDRWLNDEQATRLDVTFIHEGDLLIARMPDPMARCCMVPSGIGDAVTVVDVAILRLGRPDIEPRYVMWAINSATFRQSAIEVSSGTTRLRISRKNLGLLQVPVPPIEIQRRLVDKIESAVTNLDAVEQACLSARRIADLLRRSLLNSAFSGQLSKESPLD